MYTLPACIFVLSLIGVIINRTNIMLLIICLEIMLLSICLNFLIISFVSKSVSGIISFILIITVVAAESAIGLSILITFYKVKGSIGTRFLNVLRG